MSTECEYVLNWGKKDERVCGEPVVYDLEIVVDDAPDPPARHAYCRTHGPWADISVLLAASSTGRLGIVHSHLRRR